MVRGVLKWRTEKGAEADALWARLQRANDGLAEELIRLSELSQEGAQQYEKLKGMLRSIRVLTREMSEKSGVPIEPPAQTRLLDACSEICGVVGGVVPGAGGFDAVALLIEDRKEIVEELEELLQGWRAEGGGGRVRLLGVREEMEGVRVEGLERYMDWL